MTNDERTQHNFIAMELSINGLGAVLHAEPYLLRKPLWI